MLRTALLIRQERRPTRVCRTPGAGNRLLAAASALRAGCSCPWVATASLSTVQSSARRRPHRSLPHPRHRLLLYAQPLVRIAALKTTAIILTPQELRISLGAEPIPVPEPFAGMFRFHLHNRLTSALPATSRQSLAAGVSNGQSGIRVHECARSVDPPRHPRFA